MERESMEKREHKIIVRAIAGVIVVVLALSGGCMFGWPQYKVWQQNKEGEAELAKAEQNRQIKVQEAKAEEEAAKSLAQAEVTRAEGKSKANEILVKSLGGPQNYMQFLWVDAMKNGQNQTIYVPTEANLPITEAGRMMQGSQSGNK